MIRASQAEGPLVVHGFMSLGGLDDIREELDRLKEEGLIEHDISWDPAEMPLGRVGGLTSAGRAFLRDIENERVWAIVLETLEAANLDLSYPLLKEVCEEIVRRYVMGKIPKEI